MYVSERPDGLISQAFLITFIPPLIRPYRQQMHYVRALTFMESSSRDEINWKIDID